MGWKRIVLMSGGYAVMALAYEALWEQRLPHHSARWWVVYLGGMAVIAGVAIIADRWVTRRDSERSGDSA